MTEKPVFNPKISYEEAKARAEELVSQMTLEEKTALIGGEEYFFIRSIPRLGIEKVMMTDATMGVNLRSEFKEAVYETHVDKTTSFPAVISLAATWNPSCAYNYAGSIGEQCRAAGIGVLLAPGMNIYRQSQCGRNFEYFGEDPYLAARMVEQYVTAVQETGVVATVKHFLANNTDYYRRRSNSIVDERTLQEIYMPAFKAGIDAGVMAAMTAYNLVNGEWCGQSSYVINDLLRGKLGFKWLVMTDWWSVSDGEKLVSSGQDIEMPYTIAADNITELLQEGKVEEKQIDRMVTSIVATCLAMDLYAMKPEPQTYVPNYPLHEVHALETARQGAVLLKNDSTLPVAPGAVNSVLLTGNFIDTVYKGGGSAVVEGYDNVSLRGALTKIWKDKLTVSENPSDDEIKNADVVFLSVGTEDAESWDRPFDLPEEQEAFVRRVTSLNSRTAVIVQSGGGINMSAWNEQAGAILYAWYPGQNGNLAVGEILAGKVNPSGKLPITIEKTFSDSPGYGYIPEGQELYSGDPHGVEDKIPVYDVAYEEGVLVGYRWYDSKKIDPLYCFGHGLSYTSFDFEGPRLSADKISEGEILSLSLTVNNTGDTDGYETVQLYVEDVESSHLRPEKELKAFSKVFIPAGESVIVELKIESTDLAFWNPDAADWCCEKGTFMLHVGSSSRDIRFSLPCELI